MAERTKLHTGDDARRLRLALGLDYVSFSRLCCCGVSSVYRREKKKTILVEGIVSLLIGMAKCAKLSKERMRNIGMYYRAHECSRGRGAAIASVLLGLSK